MCPAPQEPLRDEPGWPLPGNGCGGVLFLLDASSGFERRLLLDWIERNRPEGCPEGDVSAVEIPASRRRRSLRLDRLEERLASNASHEDWLLAPLRVAWLPPKLDGQRAARWRDLLHFRDPRDPGALRQRWIARRERDRVRIVAGEPAPASELRERWRRSMGDAIGETTGLAEFVARQAAMALERAERRLRGARYKVPRFVREDILGRPAFRGGIAALARDLGRSEAAVARDATRYLREIAATHSTMVIDLVARLIHRFYTQGYTESIHYDRKKLEQVKSISQRHSVVFLPTHKSNLDHLALQYMLYENGMPPNHTAGGINMNFFPVGPLVRRSGVFFIRRSFKDNEVYKFVLRSYIDYLVEKRFPLEWYIEGGRSRSGKLLPPRFGMLAYVVDAYRRGRCDDLVLIPVSIAYDQISDVADYAAEQRGAAKQKESFSWFVGFVRRMRRRYGAIHIDFGEPLSLAKALGPSQAESEIDTTDADARSLEVQKLAFEVCVRINSVTPITPTSLVTMALLGAGSQAQTVQQVMRRLENLLRDVHLRRLPNTALDELETPEGVERVLESLAANEVVDRFSGGNECVYRIGVEREHTAAYYRNSIIHFFLNGAITELAVLQAAAAEGEEDRVAVFWREALELRDVLKFEFFFADKDSFRSALQREMVERDPEWEIALSKGQEEALLLLRKFKPFNAHRVLRPFLEAYRVVFDRLVMEPVEQPIDEGRFLDACLGLGQQYHLQRRVHSSASVSKVLFQTALRVARNRGLLEPGGEERAAARRAFAAQILTYLKRIDAVDALAASRRVGLIE